MTFLENNILNTNLYGFRRGKGTATAIAIAYEQIAQALAQNHQCNIIMRDVSKAFDKVWHSGLKHKLIDIQMPEPITKLLCNFLEERKVKIKINNHVGNPISLQSGVPQGSVISPTLYILYTSCLPPPTQHHVYIAYADDVTQLVTHPGKSKKHHVLANTKSHSKHQPSRKAMENKDQQFKVPNDCRKQTNPPPYHQQQH